MNPQHSFDVDEHAVAAQQHGKSSKSEAAPFRCEFFESCSQHTIILVDRDVTNHPSIHSKVAARLPFADVELFTSRLHGSTFQCRR